MKSNISIFLSYYFDHKGNGSVAAFGWNSDGQLGVGSTSDVLIPTIISNLNNVIQVDGGYGFSLFLFGISIFI